MSFYPSTVASGGDKGGFCGVVAEGRVAGLLSVPAAASECNENAAAGAEGGGVGASSWETTVSAATVELIEEKAGRSSWSLENRQFRYWLLDRLHGLLPYESRERACHRISSDSSSVTLNRATGKARYCGVCRCENPWVCPLCAPIIQAARAEQVSSVLKWGHAEGVAFLKLAFTCAHELGDPLADLLDRQVKALRSFKGARAVRLLLREIGFIGSVTSKEATWGPSAGWHPHQHEYWMCSRVDGVDLDLLKAKLSAQWSRACERQGLYANPAFGLYLGRRKEDEIKAGAESGYLTKSGTAAGYLVKSGTAAAIELAGGAYKQASKPHKQGHLSPMELLATDRPWADELFLEFYRAFKGRKQLVFSRAILRIYGDLFGTEPGEDWEPVEVDNGYQKDDEVVIALDYGRLNALREAKKAVTVLELVESGRIREAADLVERVWADWVDERYRRAVAWYRADGAAFGPDPAYQDGVVLW